MSKKTELKTDLAHLDADYQFLRARYDDLRAAVENFLGENTDSYYALVAAYERTSPLVWQPDAEFPAPIYPARHGTATVALDEDIDDD